MTRWMVLLPILAAVVVMTGCEETANGIVRAAGKVVYVDLEGGFYGLVTDKGTQYDPLNLPGKFQKDQLRVRFVARLQPDLAGIRMWGTIVEILEIEPR